MILYDLSADRKNRIANRSCSLGDSMNKKYAVVEEGEQRSLHPKHPKISKNTQTPKKIQTSCSQCSRRTQSDLSRRRASTRINACSAVRSFCWSSHQRVAFDQFLIRFRCIR